MPSVRRRSLNRGDEACRRGWLRNDASGISRVASGWVESQHASGAVWRSCHLIQIAGHRGISVSESGLVRNGCPAAEVRAGGEYTRPVISSACEPVHDATGNVWTDWWIGWASSCGRILPER